jgi:aspartate-semialdehyde dehydrogenase
MTNRNNETKGRKMKVAVLGATGIVGQVFVHMLSQHHTFELELISASSPKKGIGYRKAVQWVLPFEMPENIKNKKLETFDIDVLKERQIKIVFSALPTDVAKIAEPLLRQNGFYIFSNASALRYEIDVPIMIPGVNPETIQLIESQGYPKNGFVVTNANCSTTGLAVALAPLRQHSIEEVYVSTYQSVSGAGYPGLPAMDILGNVIPHIKNEEKKMEIELKKIFQDDDIKIYPQCIRIPILFGHLETVWICFEEEVSKEEILSSWEQADSVTYCEEMGAPQPHMSFWGSVPGMQVYVGGLKEKDGKIGFTLLVNNLVLGAAGGSIRNAETFLEHYGGIE